MTPSPGQNLLRLLAGFAIAGGLSLAPAMADESRAVSGGGYAMGAYMIAAQDNPFSTLVGKPRNRRNDNATRTVERYVLASDNRAFLFEDRGGDARIQYLCGSDDPRLDCKVDPDGGAAEIYLMRATRAPRGDIVYRNANDEALLRIASYGGATVFWPGETEGRAASKSFGDNHSLDLVFTDYETADRRARLASAMLSAKTGAPIVFELGGPPPAEDRDVAVLADAVVMAAKGLDIVARDPIGARVIASRIKQVTFAPSAVASVQLRGAIVEIGYHPDQGLAGRPSSAQIVKYLEETL